jgi:AraC family transcriptional regulator
LYYFATLFKKSTGLSPHRYILHRRVSRARQLLQNTDLSVLDVSLDLGFQHQNNFARAFRRVTGMTPTGFRQSNRLKQ